MNGPLRHYEFRYWEGLVGHSTEIYVIVAAHDASDALVQFRVERPTATLTRVRPVPGYDVWDNTKCGRCARGCCTWESLGVEPVKS